MCEKCGMAVVGGRTAAEGEEWTRAFEPGIVHPLEVSPFTSLHLTAPLRLDRHGSGGGVRRGGGWLPQQMHSEQQQNACSLLKQLYPV